MCGIVGIMRFDGGSIDEKRLTLMRDTMTHRGPDNGANYISPRGVSPGVGLGHRRLSILDITTRGHQPMGSDDGRYRVVYNGEVYNFMEIREELKGKGYRFSSSTDTEVILNAYREWGDGVVKRISGMFAFGIWDEEERSLFIIRDPMGIKPLYYYYDKDCFIFASELKGILASGYVNGEIDYEALKFYLTLNYIPAPYTIYKGIRKLLPGHMMSVTERGVEISRYYDLIERVRDREAINYEDATYELRDRVMTSVKRRLVSDVPLGAFLSGGLDSSIITGVMDGMGIDVKTFTIGFEDNDLFDETPYAKAVIDNGKNITSTIYSLSADELFTLIPEVLDSLDEPFGDFSTVPTFLVSKKTREEVTVALSGDGADELFGGYRKYLGEEYSSYYRKIPGFLRKKAIEPIINLMPQTRGTRPGEFGRSVSRFVKGANDEAKVRHFNWLSLADAFNTDGLLGEGLLNHFGKTNKPADLVFDLFDAFDSDVKNKMFYTDTHLVLPDDMLVKVDLMSMQNSLEVRVPFLDTDVVELAFSLPGDYKLSGRKRKKILQDAFRSILPEKVIDRPKRGFEMPIGEWFKGRLEPLFMDVVSEDAVKDFGVFRHEKVMEIFREHKKNRRDHTFLLWNIFALSWWARRRPGGMNV